MDVVILVILSSLTMTSSGYDGGEDLIKKLIDLYEDCVRGNVNKIVCQQKLLAKQKERRNMNEPSHNGLWGRENRDNIMDVLQNQMTHNNGVSEKEIKHFNGDLFQKREGKHTVDKSRRITAPRDNGMWEKENKPDPVNTGLQSREENYSDPSISVREEYNHSPNGLWGRGLPYIRDELQSNLRKSTGNNDLRRALITSKQMPNGMWGREIHGKDTIAHSGLWFTQNDGSRVGLLQKVTPNKGRNNGQTFNHGLWGREPKKDYNELYKARWNRQLPMDVITLDNGQLFIELKLKGKALNNWLWSKEVSTKGDELRKGLSGSVFQSKYSESHKGLWRRELDSEKRQLKGKSNGLHNGFRVRDLPLRDQETHGKQTTSLNMNRMMKKNGRIRHILANRRLAIKHKRMQHLNMYV